MKKLLAFVIAAVMTLFAMSAFASVESEVGDLSIFINGRLPDMGAAKVVNGRTMVPMDVFFEELGIFGSFEAETNTIVGLYPVLNSGPMIITMQVSNSLAFINQDTVELDAAPIMDGGTVLVPLRFIAEKIGCVVVWDEETSAVSVATPAVDVAD